MNGCRELTDKEFNKLMDYFSDNGNLRNRTIFSVQRWTGYRISEVLSLKVKDVYYRTREDDMTCVGRIYVQPKSMKGGRSRRKIIVHDRLREDLMEYLEEIKQRSTGQIDPHQHLFQSRKGNNKPISYVQAWRILNQAYDDLDIRENVATHSLRKMFANDVYEKTDHDIIATMNLMGHSSPDVTKAYISSDQEKLDQAVLAQ